MIFTGDYEAAVGSILLGRSRVVVCGFDVLCRSFILSSLLRLRFLRNSETVGAAYIAVKGDLGMVSEGISGWGVLRESSNKNGESIFSTLSIGECLASPIKFFSELAKLSKTY